MKSVKLFFGVSILIVLCILTTSTSTITENIKEKEKVQWSPSKKEIELYKAYQKSLHSALEKYFEKAILKEEIVGAGVSIVQGDSILISEGFGKRDILEKSAVNGETVFRLGSLSKGFTGVLAADLKSEGKINWNDKIGDYLPQFQLGNRENTSKVTLAHILSHTSGTAYHSFTNLVEDGLPISTIAEKFNTIKPVSSPGQLYSYQNAIFSLSQEVFNKVTGNDITTNLMNRFFTPLGMTTVSMSHDAITKNNNVALPHTKGAKGWRSLPLTNKYYNAVAAGGINASSLDMAKWMKFLLGHNPEVMEKKAVEEVFNPIIPINGHRKYYQRWAGHASSSYGLGWRIHKLEDTATKEMTTVWHHGGSVNNYRNEVALFPESDLGICVLLNGNSKLAKTVIPDLRAIVKQVYESSIKNTTTPAAYASLNFVK